MSSSRYFTQPSNFRELGNIQASTGVVRSKAVFRSDDVTTATDEFLVQLAGQYKVTDVVDLRMAKESLRSDRSRLKEFGFNYHGVPLGGQVLAGYKKPANDEEMASFYVRLIEQHSHDLVQILRLILESSGAVLFHCSLGKDRTGVVASLLLSALGVAKEAIVADYVRTQENLGALLERLKVQARRREGAGELPDSLNLRFLEDLDLVQVPAVFDARGEVIQEVLNKLTQSYGEPVGVLREAGLDGQFLAELRAKLILTDRSPSAW